MNLQDKFLKGCENMQEKKLRDYFWVWGHHTNCLYGAYGLTRVNDVSPVEGVDYLGATNLVLDIMDAPVDRREEIGKAKDIPMLAWSVMDVAAHPEHITDLIEYKKEFPNLTRGIFDDFLCPANTETNYTNYPLEMLARYREMLHEAGLEMWMVLYTENFRVIDKETIQAYVNEFDGVSLWFWNEKEVTDGYDEYVETFFEMTEGKKRMIGCYLYDFGTEVEATGEAVVYQLEKEREMIKKGLIEGVVLHTNAVIMQDPFEAVEAGKKWMDENGDEIITR